MARTTPDLFGPQPGLANVVYGGTDGVIHDRYQRVGIGSAPTVRAAHADLEAQQQGHDGDDECDQLRELDFAHSGSLHEHGSRGIRAESRTVRGSPQIGRLGRCPIRGGQLGGGKHESSSPAAQTAARPWGA
jgi:hypothetical protein